ncbi:hypothetical protein Mapa_002954 [Marchantia paleacea]|nr:hypothetical protein Mapa_002954 [Marchantia paleacea]
MFRIIFSRKEQRMQKRQMMSPMVLKIFLIQIRIDGAGLQLSMWNSISNSYT